MYIVVQMLQTRRQQYRAVTTEGWRGGEPGGEGGLRPSKILSLIKIAWTPNRNIWVCFI